MKLSSMRQKQTKVGAVEILNVLLPTLTCMPALQRGHDCREVFLCRFCFSQNNKMLEIRFYWCRYEHNRELRRSPLVNSFRNMQQGDLTWFWKTRGKCWVALGIKIPSDYLFERLNKQKWASEWGWRTQFVCSLLKCFPYIHVACVNVIHCFSFFVGQ